MPRLLADGREFPISPDAWQALKKAAQPFELPDDVLRRVLGLRTPNPTEVSPAANGSVSTLSRPTRRSAQRTKKARSKRSRVASELLLPETEYEVPILRALVATGGRRPTREVIDEVGKELNSRLTEVDREPVRDGSEPRWQNRVQFARLRLVKAGFMKADSPRGVWEIAPAGEQRLTEASR